MLMQLFTTKTDVRLNFDQISLMIRARIRGFRGTLSIVDVYVDNKDDDVIIVYPDGNSLVMKKDTVQFICPTSFMQTDLKQFNLLIETNSIK
jgi:hypothetical protein